MKALILFLLRVLYRFRVENLESTRTQGPVLLIPNHVSWIDWLFLGAVLEEDWKFVVSSRVAETSPLHRLIMRNRRTFPVDTTSPYAVRHMAEHLLQGGRLVLFAEGRISDTGTLMKLFDGTGFLMFKTRARVVTAYLRGAERTSFGRQKGLRKWNHPVSLHFSQVYTPPHPEHLGAMRSREALTRWLRDRMVDQRFEVDQAEGPHHLLDAVRSTARQRPDQVILEDITGKPLTYRRLLLGAELIARILDRELGQGRSRVGVLLPNINATPVALLALWALDRVPCLLNFSTGIPVMKACLKLAGVREVLTSRAFLQQAKLDPSALEEAGFQLRFLEDLKAAISPDLKFIAAAIHRILPESILNLATPGGSLPRSPDDTAVVLFTSGSEGVPKGVELSHRNILSNIRQMLAVTDLTDQDRLFNALPLFHSFGLTVGLFLPLTRGLYSFLYPSPLHYRIVPSVLYDRNCTVFLSTNTFLNGYARKAHPYDFRSLRLLFSAAEKLQEATERTWARRFGVRVLEGYGATECAPCVSVNSPLDPRSGSVGRLLPGMECRFEPVPGVEVGGRLQVRGPNIMKGYLNTEANAHFQELEGWYDTGDIVSVDEEGFLHIQGRLKRFAKISGEMVSLTAVEDALAGAFPQYGLRCTVAVISRPDPDKGERLIAVSNEPRMTIQEVREMVRAKGLPNLAAPREILSVASIPKLGTGKIDYRSLQALLETAD